MEKEEQNYSSSAPIPASFTGLDHYSLDHHHHLMKSHEDRIGENCDNNNNGIMVDYMLHNPNNNNHHQQQQISSNLSFADVMQFADFGPKLALNQTKISEDQYQETGMIDPVYFLKFPVLNDKPLDDNNHDQGMVGGANNEEDKEEEGNRDLGDEDQTRVSDNSLVKLGFLGEDNMGKNSVINVAEGGKNKRKRPRTIKTSEEVESQRMTHIAVERNRRKQMNEHLRVLRSLMPGSYVQRGDQASIIGGAIEFVRELEQLLQCLESQKRRRLYGESPPMARQAGDANNNTNNNNNNLAIQQPPILFPPLGLSNDMESGLQEETAENKSGFADVEVKVLGFDAIIKILSRRRPGQLVKTIAALEDLQLNILHTNITTIEQTVLYSFNVKVGGEMRFTAEDIASSVQQIFSFIHANATV